jgi:chemotaxis protein CheX
MECEWFNVTEIVCTNSPMRLLSECEEALKNVLPLNFQVEKNIFPNSYIEINIGVLIGFTGEVKGKLILIGSIPVFSYIGELMFGMPLEGELLESFIGGLG